MSELLKEYKYFDHPILFNQNDYYFLRKVLKELLDKDHKNDTSDTVNNFFHQFDVNEGTIKRCNGLIDKLNIMIEHGHLLSENNNTKNQLTKKEV